MSTQSQISVDSEAVTDPVRQLGPWFHNLHLPDGSQTCPDHFLGDFPSAKWRQIAPLIPADLSGWSCLDIGCNAGFYSIELARRGARVLGIDMDERYLRQARWAAGVFGLQQRIRLEQMQVYDLAHRDERFDLVLFMGVLYHLRYPMLGLDIVCPKVARLMIFQTLTMPGEEVFTRTWGRGFEQREVLCEPGWPRMAFFEHGFAGDPTNWWAPSHSGVQAMLRAAGMRIFSNPAHEIYFCEPDPQRPSAVATWNAAELASATGRRSAPAGPPA